MKRTYEIKTDTYHTTIILKFLNHMSEFNIFREVFALDSLAAVSVSATDVTPFVIVVFNNQPAESLATLIEMIEAAGFVKEATNV